MVGLSLQCSNAYRFVAIQTRCGILYTGGKQTANAFSTVYVAPTCLQVCCYETRALYACSRVSAAFVHVPSSKHTCLADGHSLLHDSCASQLGGSRREATLGVLGCTNLVRNRFRVQLPSDNRIQMDTL